MRYTLFAFLGLMLVLAACSSDAPRGKGSVVIYTSLDQIFSEPILGDFEAETGIKVRALYDTEAAKTTGMVNRLIAEKSNPQADVFWNSEVGRTIILKNKGVLAPYKSPSAADIPAEFKDAEGYWAGFAARARILIYNTDLVSPDDVPGSIFELTEPKWRGQVALANPLFGTTATHTAALFLALGDEGAREYFEALKQNDVVIVPGNATSRDRVRDGEILIGFTDTDDANIAIRDGKPVGIVFPDTDGIGTLLIPNTIAMIKNGPNPENAKKLIDYLLSEEVESKLAFARSAQIPLRAGVERPEGVPDFESVKTMTIDFERIAAKMEETAPYLQALYVE
jgi:iron(III) transport system substrate-binding protein